MSDIRFVGTTEGVSVDNLHGFFDGWPVRPSSERLLDVLNNSYRVVLAIDPSGDVVGFVSAVSDGVLSAYIPLLEVRRDSRGCGIGTELMLRILASLGHLYMIDLVCDEHVQPFYERVGMKRCVGMSVRNYERQSARGTA